MEGRRCFVTVGATASFLKLLREVLEPEFLGYLGSQGFDELVVQTGPDHDWALKHIESLGLPSREPQGRTINHGSVEARWPVIQAVSYTTDITSLMLPCRGESRRPPGAMISHAGSGSILDAARCDVPLIVVANPDLLGNHQEELADAVHEAGWAVKGELGHLADAVEQLQKNAAQAQIDILPLYQEPVFPTPEDERCSLFDWTAMYAGQGPGTTTAEPNLLRLD